MTPVREWTVGVHFAVWLGLYTTVVGLIGLAINPDFAVGDDATAESFMWVDWNGWHGLAAISVGLPGIAIAWVPRAALAYLAYRAVSDAAVSVWAAVDDRPLGVLFLPTSGDAVLHAVIAAAAATGVALALRRRALAPPAALT